MRDQSWRSGTKCDCKTDWLWVRSPLEEMKYLLKFIFPFLRMVINLNTTQGKKEESKYLKLFFLYVTMWKFLHFISFRDNIC